MSHFLSFILLSTFCFADIPTIITGASGELGTAAAKLLAQDYNIILTGRNRDKLEQLQVSQEDNFPHQYSICTLDFLSSSSISLFNDYLKQLNVPISGIALISSRPDFDGKALLQTEEKWLQVFQANFIGPLEALKVVIPHLANSSKVVILTGVTSVQVCLETGASCVIRRMWTTYCKAISHELGPQGININCLSPGVVMTDFHQKRIKKGRSKWNRF